MSVCDLVYPSQQTGLNPHSADGDTEAQRLSNLFKVVSNSQEIAEMGFEPKSVVRIPLSLSTYANLISFKGPVTQCPHTTTGTLSRADLSLLFPSEAGGSRFSTL